MKRIGFQQLHPLTLLLLFLEVLITCFCARTAGLSVMFCLLFVFSVLQSKAKAVLWTLPLAVFIFLLNPIFYHGGETVFFTLWGYAFTLEAVWNGLNSALLILCTTLIFTVLGSCLGEEKFLYVFGKFFPRLALMVSMIFKHFEILSESYRQTKNMAKMNGIYQNDHSLFQKLKTNAVIFEAFTGAALEGSVETALSLAAKGYYSKHKTSIKSYRLHAADGVIIVLSTVFFALTFFKMPCNLIATALLMCIPISLVKKEDSI